MRRPVGVGRTDDRHRPSPGPSVNCRARGSASSSGSGTRPPAASRPDLMHDHQLVPSECSRYPAGPTNNRPTGRTSERGDPGTAGRRTGPARAHLLRDGARTNPERRHRQVRPGRSTCGSAGCGGRNRGDSWCRLPIRQQSPAAARRGLRRTAQAVEYPESPSPGRCCSAQQGPLPAPPWCHRAPPVTLPAPLNPAPKTAAAPRFTPAGQPVSTSAPCARCFHLSNGSPLELFVGMLEPTPEPVLHPEPPRPAGADIFGPLIFSGRGRPGRSGPAAATITTNPRTLTATPINGGPWASTAPATSTNSPVANTTAATSRRCRRSAAKSSALANPGSATCRALSISSSLRCSSRKAP